MKNRGYSDIFKEIQNNPEYDKVGDAYDLDSPEKDPQDAKKELANFRRKNTIMAKKIEADMCKINPFEAIKKLEEKIVDINSEYYVTTAKNQNQHISEINELKENLNKSTKRFGRKAGITSLKKELSKKVSFLVRMIQSTGHTQSPAMQCSEVLNGIKTSVEKLCKKEDKYKKLLPLNHTDEYNKILDEIANSKEFDDIGEYWESYKK